MRSSAADCKGKASSAKLAEQSEHCEQVLNKYSTRRFPPFSTHSTETHERFRSPKIEPPTAATDDRWKTIESLKIRGKNSMTGRSVCW